MLLLLDSLLQEMSDDVHNREQAREIAQAVQKALVDSSSSQNQNFTINLNYSPVYNNYNGDNISLYSSSPSSINSINGNGINGNSINGNSINNSSNIVEHNNNHNNQPMQIQTKPFLKTTVYDSDEVAKRKLHDLCFDGTAQSLDQICRGTAKVVDERGEGHKA